MKIIKLDFCDFWPGYNKTDNYFYHLLKTRYSIEISNTPDFLIYSVFGQEHRKYNCYKIFYTDENIRPKFDECNFAFTFDYISQDNHYRLPLYALSLYEDPESLSKHTIDVDQILSEKTKFCNFVYSNGRAEKRTEFFYKLSKYKQVDSGGYFLNNIGGLIGGSLNDKLDFIRPYKFTIAFENSSHPGYTTEKIVHPMQVHSIPIYWGNPFIHFDFNPKSFLSYYCFATEDDLIEKIIELDQNDTLYKEYLLEPYFYNNKDNEYIRSENVLNQFEQILG